MNTLYYIHDTDVCDRSADLCENGSISHDADYAFIF